MPICAPKTIALNAKAVTKVLVDALAALLILEALDVEFPSDLQAVEDSEQVQPREPRANVHGGSVVEGTGR